MDVIHDMPWYCTADACKWPTDFGLSVSGLTAALGIGERLHKVAVAASAFHVIITSPYCRCGQTDAEICKQLGQPCRLMVDYYLGEVVAPSILGDIMPIATLRPMKHTLSFCSVQAVMLAQDKVLGRWPLWQSPCGLPDGVLLVVL